MEPLKPIDDKPWPSGLRKLLNKCASLLNRPWTISFEDVQSAKVEQSETNVKIVFPKSISNSAGNRDLQLYTSGGDIGVRFGNVTPAIARASGVNVWPDVFSATSDPPWTYTFTPSGTGVAYLQVTVDPGSSTTAPKVTNITISAGASLPTNTDTVGYFPLGNFTITDGVARVLNSEGIGSQGYIFCGRDHYLYSA